MFTVKLCLPINKVIVYLMVILVVVVILLMFFADFEGVFKSIIGHE